MLILKPLTPAPCHQALPFSTIFFVTVLLPNPPSQDNCIFWNNRSLMQRPLVGAALVAALSIAGKPCTRHETLPGKTSPPPSGRGAGGEGNTKKPQRQKNRPTRLPTCTDTKRQQKNGAKSPTKTPTPDTKWCKIDPNGAKIKKVPFLPPPAGRGAGVRGYPSLPSRQESCSFPNAIALVILRVHS